jgi:hypothetical protein
VNKSLYDSEHDIFYDKCLNLNKNT